MIDTRKQTGTKGEDFASRYLEQAGIKIIERNWRCQAGEADIIADESGTLVFVEVKTRRSIAAGFPEESVTKAKRRRYETIAAYYLSLNDSPSTRVRFDVIGVMLTGEEQAFVKHHRDVFAAGE